jgi:transmembrane sensor
MDKEKENIDIRLITLYLSGEANPEEIERLQLWKNASADNLAEYNDFVSVWGKLGNTSADKNIDIEKEWNIHQNVYLPHQQPKNVVFIFRPFMKVAASILFIIGSSIAAWFYFSDTTINTDVAELHEVVLSDSSIVTLNANSKLTYSSDFGTKNRLVYLKGEAFFKVRKNAKLPFQIKTGSAEIRVLGTSFNVKAYSGMNNIEVTVAEGRVGVFAKNITKEPVVITSGQKAFYNVLTDSIIFHENENKNFIAWKTKSMVFENDSLPYVIKTIGEVYHVDIAIETKALNQCTITTKFDNNDLPSVLKILKSTLNIAIEVRDNKIFIRGKAC